MDKRAKKFAAVFFVAALAVTALSPVLLASDDVTSADNRDSINAFFRSINYDPDTVISATSGTGSVVPTATSETSGDKTTTVTYTKKTLGDNSTEVLKNLSYESGVVYPGSLMVANSQLANGTPSSLTPEDRSKVKLSVSLIGGSIEADPSTPADVASSVEKKLDEWAKTSSIAKMNVDTTYDIAYSQHQISVSLGLSTDALGKIDINSDYSSEGTTTTYVMKYQQIYYTVNAEKKPTAADYFGEKTTVATLKNQLTDKDGTTYPAVYTTSVTYGRLIVVSVKSTADSSELNTVIKAHVSGTTASLSEKQKEIDNELKVSGVVLGGQAVGKKTVSSFEDIKELLDQKLTVDDIKCGEFISANTAFIDNGTNAASCNPTEYVEKTVSETTDIKVEFKQKGAYVGCFNLYWTSFKGIDKDGNFTGVNSETLSSGNVCTGTYTLSVPSNHESDFSLSLWACWGTKVMNHTSIPLPQKSIEIYMNGTTCDVSYYVYVDGVKVAGDLEKS